MKGGDASLHTAELGKSEASLSISCLDVGVSQVRREFEYRPRTPKWGVARDMYATGVILFRRGEAVSPNRWPIANLAYKPPRELPIKDISFTKRCRDMTDMISSWIRSPPTSRPSHVLKNVISPVHPELLLHMYT